MARYLVTIAARTPAESAPPSLVEVGPVLDASSLQWTDVLNAPGEASFSCDPAILEESIRSRLRALDAFPCEVWIARDGVPVFAGPIIGIQPAPDRRLTIRAASLLYYLRYMFVEGDEVFTADDQWTIARRLVAQWQEADYGDFGIDVSAVTTSGITRDRSYLGTVEEHNVAQRLAELADVIDGFDFWIPPATRELELAAARGSDLSASVFLDQRGITNPSSATSVAAGDIASEAFGRSYDPGAGAPLTATATNATLRQSFGRTGISATFEGISVQATLDDYTAGLLASRGTPYFVAAPGLIPVAGAGVGDFDVGDTVTWDFDDGLGRRTEPRRVVKRTINVDDEATEAIALDFA